MMLKRCIFFIALFAIANSECEDLDHYFRIRSRASEQGLVVDARTNTKVTIQEVEELDSQLWKLSPSKNVGSFNILNKQNGAALDVDVNSRPDYPSEYDTVLRPLSDSPTQQWYVDSDSIIINAGMVNNSLDIRRRAVNSPGAPIIIFDRYDDNVIYNIQFDFIE